MVQVIECVSGRYEAQDVEFGVVYRWYPECVVVECGCGEAPTLTASTTNCDGCGADHEAVVREKLAAQRLEKDETVHPWRYAEDRKGISIPF